MLKETPRPAIEMLLDEYPADMILIGNQRLSLLYPEISMRLTWNYKQLKRLMELAK